MLTWVLPLISLSEYLANVPPTNPLSGEAKLEASKKLPQLLEFARAVIGALGQLADERANDILLALRDGQVTQLLVKHQDPNVRCFLLRTSAGEDGTDRQLHPSLRATVTKAIKRVSRISAT
jgi:hypothetical protein